MYHLILIFGMFADPDAGAPAMSISQQQYSFANAKSCENAKKYYSGPYIKYLNKVAEEVDSRVYKTTISAECWPD